MRAVLRFRSVFCPFIIAALIPGCGGGGGSSTPVTPPPPSTITAPLPWVYTQVFSSGSPLHVTVAAQMANGAKKLSATAMSALWSQGVANQDLSDKSWMFPVYVSQASDADKVFTCKK